MQAFRGALYAFCRSLAIPVDTGDGKFHPFCDIGAVIADPLKVFGDHLQDKISVQNTRLIMGKWIVFHDVYGDGFLTDWMVQRRIKKLIQAVEDAHQEVMRARDRLLD